MRDNGSPEHEVQRDLNWFDGLAREALKDLVAARNQRLVDVRSPDLDHFMNLLARSDADDPATLVVAMRDRQLGPDAVAQVYVPAAARRLGQQWEADQITFVDVTVRTERLHRLIRHIADFLTPDKAAVGTAFLILVPDGEQHTLGASVLAARLRMAGFTAHVRTAPVAAELTILLTAARYDMAMVSVGCDSGLAAAAGLVKMLRLLSRDSLRITVGGSIPLSDDELKAATGADSVQRDIAALVVEFGGKTDGDVLRVKPGKA